MHEKATMPAACYGYVRYSSDRQEHGDSVRRQTDAMLKWIERNKDRVQLDTSLGEGGFYIDRGMSGFAPTGERRLNLGDSKLGEFIKACESNRIAPGSFLLVESADRVSRESTVIALNLFTSLIMLGVVVVTLTPDMEYKTDADIGKLITVGVTIGRAHDESQIKSKRNPWVGKRLNAATQPMTSNLPGWCKLVGAKRLGTRLVGGEIRADAGKAETVRRLFKLLREGKGCKRIAEQLNGDKTPVVGRGARWTESSVYNILTSRAVIGEFRPHTGVMGSAKKLHTRKPTGEVFEGYYPVVVDREEFVIAQQLLHERAGYRGRRGHHVNLFANLLYDARDGGKFTYRNCKTHPTTLIPSGAKSGAGGPWSSFNADVFDALILSQLAELKVADIMPENDHGGDVVRLSALYAEKDTELRGFQRDIDGDPRLLKSLRPTLLRLEEEREKLAGDLAQAQREAASPLAESWGEFQSIAGLLKRDNSDDMRTRCRAALRRLIESVHCVFTGSKMVRLAAVRVQFRGSAAHRDYALIHYGRNGTRKNPPEPSVESMSWPDSEGGELDLRKPGDAAKVVDLLTRALDHLPR